LGFGFFIYSEVTGMSPHWQRGWDAPSANAPQKTKIQTHVCAITGEALFGNFFVLKKVPRLSGRDLT